MTRRVHSESSHSGPASPRDERVSVVRADATTETPAGGPPPEGASLKSRLAEELRKYLLVSAYLYLCLGALLLYKAAVLEQDGVHYVPLGVALGKALILGKFLLIGDALKLGARGTTPGLFARIARRVFLLLALLLVLTTLEELLVAWLHGSGASPAWEELAARPPLLWVAELLLMGLILLPLVAATEVYRSLGSDRLRRLFDPPAAPTARNEASVPAVPQRKRG